MPGERSFFFGGVKGDSPTGHGRGVADLHSQRQKKIENFLEG